MKNTKRIAAIAAFTVSFAATADTVRIGTEDVELELDAGFSGMVATNRIVAEMNRFFAAAEDLSVFFDAADASPDDPAQLNPGIGGGGPDVDEAADILYYPGEPAKIRVGANALEWLCGVISEAAPHADALRQAETLVASLSSGSLTNDIAAARAAFSVNGKVLSSDEFDGEILRGLESYWKRLQYCPLTLLDWKTGRFEPDGPLVPSIRFKFRDADIDPDEIGSHLLVFIDGRWRVALFN